MKTTPFSFAAITLLVAASTASALGNEVPPISSEVPVVFDPVPESLKTTLAPDPGESSSPLLAEHEGARMTLFGKLIDTSTQNLFYASWYDGRETHVRRFYVEGHPYKKPGYPNSVWVTVDATLSKADLRHDDRNEIRIHSYHSILEEDVQRIARASATSQLWMSANREKIDLNEFKEKYSENVRMVNKNWNKDFNKLPRKDDIEIRAMDLKRGVVELLCSQYTIEEEPGHHAHYVELVMFYDLKKDAPIRLLVRKGGYHLE